MDKRLRIIKIQKEKKGPRLVGKKINLFKLILKIKVLAKIQKILPYIIIVEFEKKITITYIYRPHYKTKHINSNTLTIPSLVRA